MNFRKKNPDLIISIHYIFEQTYLHATPLKIWRGKDKVNVTVLKLFHESIMKQKLQGERLQIKRSS